jgi:hypothetical protein
VIYMRREKEISAKSETTISREEELIFLVLPI